MNVGTWKKKLCWTDDATVDPTVPKTMKGTDAPTESERTADDVTHLPPGSWCETCLERGERPIIAVDLAVREARADDGGADDDLGRFLAIVDSSTGCVRATAS